jgi:non-specific serine/threonine protein kinase
MKYDIFISYSRKDFDEVNAFVKMLEEQIPTLTCWFDITGIESGDEFEEKIISAINNSSYVLFAMSDNSMQSKWTRDEVIYAGNIGKKVIPIILKGGQLDGWFLFKFGRIDCIDSTNSIQVEKLVRNLSKWTSERNLHTLDDTSGILSIPQGSGGEMLIGHSEPVGKSVYDSGKEIIEECIETDKEKNTIGEFGTRKNIIIWKSKVFYLSIAILSIIVITWTILRQNKIVTVENTIDLGLPSGTLWRTCNLGANNEYDQGLLYVWGSITPLSKDQLCSQKAEDYEKIIGTSYDAASIILGSQWRMPSEMQIAELIAHCKWEWQDEHCGYIVIGPNGNSMFLPAAGCIIGDEIKYEGQFGYYWTGESKNRLFAKELLIGIGQVNIESGRKNVGRSIRAVYLK